MQRRKSAVASCANVAARPEADATTRKAAGPEQRLSPYSQGVTTTARDLRAAVEAVLAVVRSDADDDPPRPVPSSLRPFVGFTKTLPAAAISAVSRCVDDDPDLRKRARAKTTPEKVGAVGWLWLDRPDGWQVEIESIRRSARATKAEGGRVRDEKADDRRAQRAERATATAKARAERAEGEVERLKRELATSRQEARATEHEINSLQADLVRLHEERGRAVRELKDVESDSAQRLTAIRALEHELAELRERFVELEVAHGDALAAIRSADRSALDGALSDPGAAYVVDEPVVHESQFDPAAVAATISAAAASVTDLSAHLTALGQLFAPPAPTGRPLDEASTPPTAVRARRAARLPVGMFDDGPEAVEYLVRVDGAVLLVDGYNVSISGWPEMKLTEQRRRLVDALDALAARSGVQPYVVFDGVDADGGLGARSGPAPVRVRFAPADIEADDVIIGLVDEYPASTPIVVASSDKRVRDGCRAKGANIVSSPQLLEVLR